MKISLIINSCSGDPAAGQPIYGWRSYRQRMELLHDEILPAAMREGWDEILVAGQFVEGKGYRYLPMPPVFRDRRDALWQREHGARFATGDLLAFSHDDHAFEIGTRLALLDFTLGVDSGVTDLDGKPVYKKPVDWDLLVPKRVDRHGTLLNNGRDDNYMGGHALVMKRALWAKVPWTTCDTEWWDTSMTRVWREEGAKIVWTDEIIHVDMDS